MKKTSFALIFGSFNSEAFSEMSDIDVAVNFKIEVDLIEVGEIVSSLEKTANRKIDIVILNDLLNKNPLLAYNIISNSKLLFKKNDDDFII
ncbi:MAG: nucleotidyltransferase domain-containing protein [Melioribacteraceae bacterium]|nr:nucleotidyltransferase domain-containing protein [Melioribacteraceae bacterium]